MVPVSFPMLSGRRYLRGSGGSQGRPAAGRPNLLRAMGGAGTVSAARSSVRCRSVIVSTAGDLPGCLDTDPEQRLHDCCTPVTVPDQESYDHA